MGDETFDEALLTEKLSKLNSSQQSIESLSRWCIFHRKKANRIVETWEKLFKSAKREQQVAFLYLSNDILQNSRRKGSEFVNEFWKVIPAALKDAYDSGNDNCRKVATRLVDIWEERKVFGSRGLNLKNEMLGSNPSPLNNVKNSNPIKVLKRDATSLRIKLALGGLPEKIFTAFQLVLDDVANEEAALDKCRNAVSCVQEIEKDVVNASSQGLSAGNLHDVMDNIQKQEDMIQQCITELEKSEAIRVDLVSQLREALHDEESKLEQLRNELLVARGQLDRAANIRLQLTSNSSSPTVQPIVEPTFPSPMPAINMTAPPPSLPITSFASSTEEDNKKATAAAVAAKLAASTSSAQMLTSILSSLVAEEAASMSSGLKRQKLEPPMSFSDGKNPEGSNSSYFPSGSQTNQLQLPFLPPLPPPPSLGAAANSSTNQVVQSNMMGQPFSYAATNLLPPPNAALGFARPGPPPHQAQLQQPAQPQPPASGGYYRPVGVGFYGQNHQPPTPPIHRQ